MDLFSQVRSLFTARETKRASDFDELVKAVADGHAPPAAAIAELLEAAGKTPADLEAEVTRRQQRIADAAKLATFPKLQLQWNELQQAGEKERARMIPLIQEHEEAIRKINAQLYGLEGEIADAQGRRQKLTASYRGPLQDELAENKGQQNELGRSIAAAEKNAAEHVHRGNIDNLIGSGGRPSQYDAGSVKWRGEAAATCREAADERRKELVPLVAREQEILAAMLVP